MSASIPVEKRLAAVEAFNSGKTAHQVALEFHVSVPSLHRYVRAWRTRGQVTPLPHGGGQPPLLSQEEQALLSKLALDHPRTALRLLLEQFRQQTGKSMATSTARRYLRQAGIGRIRPVAAASTGSSKTTARPTRYRATHRREPTPTSYPSDLTDAEWALLEPMFSQEGQRGRPSLYGQRALLNGIFYVLRTGCPWRLLPHDLPPWSTVHAAFKRWSRNGRFKQAVHRLRRQWRKEAGRAEEPTAAVADSQSTKTTEKGGPAVMTAARK